MPIDVLIVGAGPTGLMLANQLGRRGIRPIIIDRHSGPAQQSRAMAVHARTLEIYSKLGIAARAVESGEQGNGANMWVGGTLKARVPLEDMGKNLSPFPYVLMLGQDENERIMGDRLRDWGIDVEWNTELVALEQHVDHVTTTIEQPDGSLRTVDAAYVAGCDGSRSAVRQMNGIGFPGAAYEQSFFVADTEATGPMVPNELTPSRSRCGEAPAGGDSGDALFRERDVVGASVRPVTKGTTDGDELAHVIRRVIGGEQDRSQVRLLRVARRHGPRQVFFVAHDCLQGLAVAHVCVDAIGPRRDGRRRSRRGPVIAGPFPGVVVRRLGAELQDVVLRQADVLQQFPGRVRKPAGPRALKLRRNALDGLVEADVSVLPFEDAHQVLTNDAGELAHDCLPTRAHRATRRPYDVSILGPADALRASPPRRNPGRRTSPSG